MSNHDLKQTDYSNSVVAQNPENASVVSIFPLVQEENNENIVSEVNGNRSQPIPPVPVNSSGGSSY